jgi:hypothetical protein
LFEEARGGDGVIGGEKVTVLGRTTGVVVFLKGLGLVA